MRNLLLFALFPLFVLAEVEEYNRGTTWLQQGDWEKALTLWSTPEVLGTLFPPLAYRLHTNYAIAKLLEAIDQNDPLDVEESLYSLKEAEEAFCRWIKALGAEECSPPRSLTILREKANEIKREIKKREAFLSFPTIEEREEGTPQALLARAIAKQTILEKLTFTAPRDTLATMQKEIQQEIAAFPEAAMAEQEKRRGTCQEEPWKQVFPWYREGWLGIEAVLEGLQKEAPRMLVRDRQKEVRRAFQQALELLEEPPPPEKQTPRDILNQRMAEMYAEEVEEEQPTPIRSLPEQKPW